METFYGAVTNYGTSIDVFICMVRVYEDAEVSIDIKRVDRAFQMRVQQIPDHHNQMTPEEELAAVGSASIPKKTIASSVEAEIMELLIAALQVPSVEVKKLRQTDLAPLF